MRFPLATVGTILPFIMKPSGALKLIAPLVISGEVKVFTQAIVWFQVSFTTESSKATCLAPLAGSYVALSSEAVGAGKVQGVLFLT